MDLFPANTPPGLAAPSTAYGPGQHGTFASEFGCSVFSSFESMSPTLAPADWSAHAPPMVQRNCERGGGGGAHVQPQRNSMLRALGGAADPTDNIVSVYFGAAVAACLNETGADALQRATYLGMLGQALQQARGAGRRC